VNLSAGAGYIKSWKFVAAAAAVWWVLGLNLFIYHIAAFFLFFQLLQKQRKSSSGTYFPSTAVLLLFLSAVYGFSILLHAPASQMSRVIAALYNLSFWFMGAALTAALANAFRLEDITKIVGAFKSISVTLAALTLVMLAVLVIRPDPIEMNTPLHGMAKYLGNTNLVKDSLVIRPLMNDWFASFSRPRLNLLAPYPTASAGLIMIVVFFLMIDAVIQKKTRSVVWMVLLGLNLAALFLTLSRMSLLAVLMSTLFVWFVGRRNLFFWTALSLLGLLLLLPLLLPFSEWLMGLRGGSTSTRMNLYRYTLDQLNGVDWILGVGIKAREESAFSIPIGSHSTYISLLYKSGILGVALFIVFQAKLFMNWFSLREDARVRRIYFLFWRGFGYVFLGMGLWMITEDIDAPQLLAFLYFSLVGLFEGFRKELKRERVLKGAGKEIVA